MSLQNFEDFGPVPAKTNNFQKIVASMLVVLSEDMGKGSRCVAVKYHYCAIGFIAIMSL